MPGSLAYRIAVHTEKRPSPAISFGRPVLWLISDMLYKCCFPPDRSCHQQPRLPEIFPSGPENVPLVTDVCSVPRFSGNKRKLSVLRSFLQ